MGKRGARLAAESHGAAIDQIEQIVKDEHIDCDFERIDGYLFLPPGESTDLLDRELAAAGHAGVNVERVERVPIEFYDFGPALRFHRQGQFHALKYVNGLAAATLRLGGRIYGNTHVTKIEDGKRHLATPRLRQPKIGQTVEVGLGVNRVPF